VGGIACLALFVPRQEWRVRGGYRGRDVEVEVDLAGEDGIEVSLGGGEVCGIDPRALV
jgi:hypothetical protein